MVFLFFYGYALLIFGIISHDMVFICVGIVSIFFSFIAAIFWKEK
jgi:hypothetical protein